MLKRIFIVLLATILLCSVELPVFAEQDKETVEQQQNAVAMLNWLSFMSRRISDSRSSRLDLEDLYAELINDIEPASVDGKTLSYITELQDTIAKFRLFQQKRDHIRYEMEQEKGKAISKAISTFLNGGETAKNLKSAYDSIDVQGSYLQGVSSFLKSGGFSVLVQVIKGIRAYDQTISDAEFKALKSGWDLDSDELQQLFNLRQKTFKYMVEIAQQYKLRGNQTLNEESVGELVYWASQTNDASRATYLESHQETYSSYGGYWLMLAESYYNQGRWQKCVDAVESYLKLDIQIFRKDKELARVLPMVIESLEHLAPNNENYKARAKRYLNLLRINAGAKDWDLHYFAAITLLDFYERTPDKNTDARWSYLKEAWNEIIYVLPELVDEQRHQNEVWIADVQYISSSAGIPEAERVAYNNMLKSRRTRELPPVYEPLLLFLDLLHVIQNAAGDAMAELYLYPEFDLDAILHPNGEVLFWNESHERDSWFMHERESAFSDLISVSTYDYGWVRYRYESLMIGVPVTSIDATSKLILSAARQSTYDTVGKFDPEDCDYFLDPYLVEIRRPSEYSEKYDPTKFQAIYRSNRLNQRADAFGYQASSSTRIDLMLALLLLNHDSQDARFGFVRIPDAKTRSDEHLRLYSYYRLKSNSYFSESTFDMTSGRILTDVVWLFGLYYHAVQNDEKCPLDYDLFLEFSERYLKN